LTYRLGAHTTSDDPTVYRSDGEVEEHKRHDPVKRLKRYLEVGDEWSQAQDDALIAQVKAELQAGIERAEKAPKPAVSTLFDKVYEKQPLHLIEQQTECENGPRPRHHR
jgi:TPP-dependent pyruvate/acetoin dehydrogenase alpha subunit